MTKDEALNIYNWVTNEPKTVRDYSISFKIEDIIEAYKILNKQLPEWLYCIGNVKFPKGIKTPKGVYNFDSKISNTFAKSLIKQRNEMAFNILKGELK